MTLCTSSPTITTSGASNTSASSVAATLPSREFSTRHEAAIDGAVLHGAHDGRHRRERDGLRVDPGGDQRVVGVRARRAQVGGAHRWA